MDAAEGNGSEALGVLLLHGLALRPLWNAALARDLRRDGWDPVLNLGYPRRNESIAAVADGVAEQLHQRFPGGVPPLHGVGHSMGGLVLRKLLADGVLPPGGRLVFLGTPHAGARKAELYGDWRLFKLVFGGAGQDLRPESAFLEELPAPPPADTLVVVGGTGRRGLSLVLREDNDGTVEASSARLPGAHELFVYWLHHGLLPLSPKVRRAVRAFLKRGRAGLEEPSGPPGARL